MTERPRRFPANLAVTVPAGKPRSVTADSSAPKPAAPRSAGLGLDSGAVRERMVDRLQAQRIGNPAIWHAMRQVPRHSFVEPGFSAQAYEDTALPIGYEQTISKPSSVAQLLVAIGAERRLRRVLDIGTGCGYQAAVLALLSGEVYSIERVQGLHKKAQTHLRPLQLFNLQLIYGDAHQLPISYGQFDAIVSAASAGDVPHVWLERLSVGGVLVAPVGTSQQHLVRICRVSTTEFTRDVLEGVNFVPLQSGKRAG